MPHLGLQHTHTNTGKHTSCCTLRLYLPGHEVILTMVFNLPESILAYNHPCVYVLLSVIDHVSLCVCAVSWRDYLELMQESRDRKSVGFFFFTLTLIWRFLHIQPANKMIRFGPAHFDRDNTQSYLMKEWFTCIMPRSFVKDFYCSVSQNTRLMATYF